MELRTEQEPFEINQDCDYLIAKAYASTSRKDTIESLVKAVRKPMGLQNRIFELLIDGLHCLPRHNSRRKTILGIIYKRADIHEVHEVS